MCNVQNQLEYSLRSPGELTPIQMAYWYRVVNVLRAEWHIKESGRFDYFMNSPILKSRHLLRLRIMMKTFRLAER